MLRAEHRSLRCACVVLPLIKPALVAALVLLASCAR